MKVKESISRVISSLEKLNHQADDAVKSLTDEKNKWLKNKTGRDVISSSDIENQYKLKSIDDWLSVINNNPEYSIQYNDSINKLQKEYNSQKNTILSKIDKVNESYKYTNELIVKSEQKIQSLKHENELNQKNFDDINNVFNNRQFSWISKMNEDWNVLKNKSKLFELKSPVEYDYSTDTSLGFKISRALSGTAKSFYDDCVYYKDKTGFSIKDSYLFCESQKEVFEELKNKVFESNKKYEDSLNNLENNKAKIVEYGKELTLLKNNSNLNEHNLQINVANTKIEIIKKYIESEIKLSLTEERNNLPMKVVPITAEEQKFVSGKNQVIDLGLKDLKSVIETIKSSKKSITSQISELNKIKRKGATHIKYDSSAINAASEKITSGSKKTISQFSDMRSNFSTPYSSFNTSKYSNNTTVINNHNDNSNFWFWMWYLHTNNDSNIKVEHIDFNSALPESTLSIEPINLNESYSSSLSNNTDSGISFNSLIDDFSSSISNTFESLTSSGVSYSDSSSSSSSSWSSSDSSSSSSSWSSSSSDYSSSSSSDYSSSSSSSSSDW